MKFHYSVILLVICSVICVAADVTTTSSTTSLPPSSPPPSFSSINDLPMFPLLPRRFRAKCRFVIGDTAAAATANDGADESSSPFDRVLAARPTLALVHFDAVKRRVREDFYAIVHEIQEQQHQPEKSASSASPSTSTTPPSTMLHRRYFTSIRDFHSSREWLIYHRQPSSPRACFEVPFTHTISSLLSAPGMPKVEEELFENLASIHAQERLDEMFEYLGEATMELEENLNAATDESDAMTTSSSSSSPSSSPSNQLTSLTNVTLLHFALRAPLIDHRDSSTDEFDPSSPPLFASDQPPIHIYFHHRTHQPLVLTTPHLRVDILNFQPIHEDDGNDNDEQVNDDEAAREGDDIDRSRTHRSKRHAGRMDAIFDPNRASKAKCISFNEGGSSRSEQRRMHDEL